MKRADKVVMGFLRFVVERRAFLKTFGQFGDVHRVLHGYCSDLFDKVEQIPSIAVRHGAQCATRVFGERQGLAGFFLRPL